MGPSGVWGPPFAFPPCAVCVVASYRDLDTDVEELRYQLSDSESAAHALGTGEVFGTDELGPVEEMHGTCESEYSFK